MPNRVHIDWYAYQAGKKTGLLIGYTEGLKVGIRVIAEMKFGPPDAQFLEDVEDMIEPGDLERVLQRLKTATSIRDVRALYTPPEELVDIAPLQNR